VSCDKGRQLGDFCLFNMN